MGIDYKEHLRALEDERARLMDEIQRLKEAERNRARLDKEIGLLKALVGLKEKPVTRVTRQGVGRNVDPDSMPSRALRVLQEQGGGPMPLRELTQEIASRHGLEMSPDLMKKIGQAMAGRPTKFKFVNHDDGWMLIQKAEEDNNNGATASVSEQVTT